MSDAIDRAREFLDREGAKRKRSRPRLTLEHGRGHTYRTTVPTLYGHSPYERGSVLYGQDMRCWLATWPAWDEARAELKAAKITFEDLGDPAGTGCGGSTFVPMSQVIAHLPVDPDYDDVGEDW